MHWTKKNKTEDLGVGVEQLVGKQLNNTKRSQQYQVFSVIYGSMKIEAHTYTSNHTCVGGNRTGEHPDEQPVESRVACVEGTSHRSVKNRVHMVCCFVFHSGNLVEMRPERKQNQHLMGFRHLATW